MDSNDHAPLVKKFNLKDDKLVDRNFVRIEMLPLGSLTSTKYKDWEFRVDEKGTLPSWFEEEKEVWKEKCLHILTAKIIPSWKKDGVGGSLDLRGTQVRSLGSLKSVGGWFDLQDTQVRSLGSLKSVGGSLDLRDTQVRSLGSLKSVGGPLYLQGTKIKIPKTLKVAGEIRR